MRLFNWILGWLSNRLFSDSAPPGEGELMAAAVLLLKTRRVLCSAKTDEQRLVAVKYATLCIGRLPRIVLLYPLPVTTDKSYRGVRESVNHLIAVYTAEAVLATRGT